VELAPVDILHQQIDLDLTMGNLIRGVCTIDLTPRIDGVSSFDLHLEALAVDSITSATGPWAFLQDDIRLTITPATTIHANDTVRFTVHYHGDPIVDPSGFGGFYTSAALTYNLGVAFQSVPHSYGRTWVPCLDDFTERSTYSFHIRTAGGKKAWCNGTLVDRIPLGGDTLINHWECSGSMPAYLVSVAAANYAEIHDSLPSDNGHWMPLSLVAAPGDTANLRASFTHLPDAFAHFEALFGPYRWEKVGYVLTTQGAMEHSTSIHYPRSIVDGSLSYETTMAHELAHHWFGNQVTCDRAEEMYINEGFAEYLSYLFLEQVYGPGRYLAEVRSTQRSMVQRAHLSDAGWWALADMPQAHTYGTHTYNKGAIVLHSLRSYMGHDAFSQGLTSFLNTYAFQPVNTLMLRDHLSQTSGMDLTDFFRDWIQQPGWAAFEIDAQHSSPGEDGWILQLSIGQKQRGPAAPYQQVPITVAVVGTDTAQVFRDTVLVGGPSTDIALTIPFEPAFVWLNDDSRLSLAVTGSTHTVGNTATINSTMANMELMPRPGPNTLVRLEQYWVAADEGITTEPFAYVISPDRYWRVTGSWTDSQRFRARFPFDGRNTMNTLDPGLMHDTLGVTFHEDSLVLLHRRTPDAPWSRWGVTIATLGSSTDGHGRMEVDSLATGEYVLAWRTSPVGVNQATPRAPWTLWPNPADHTIHLTNLEPDTRGTIRMLDARGRIVMTTNVAGPQTTIHTEGLPTGHYTVTFSDDRRTAILIGNVIVEH
jgi:aminopeptidase N